MWGSAALAWGAAWSWTVTLERWLVDALPAPASALASERDEAADALPPVSSSTLRREDDSVVATETPEATSLPAPQPPVRPENLSPSQLEASVPREWWLEQEWERCSGVFVYIVSISDHGGAHSSASLAAHPAGKARFRRVGQSVGDWEVLWISDDWSGVNPAVWLIRGQEVCRAELAGNPQREIALQREAKKQAAAKRAAKRRAKAKARARKRRRSKRR